LAGVVVWNKVLFRGEGGGGMGILGVGLLRWEKKSKSLRDMGERKDGCRTLIYMSK
jgi:hypothetical protein